MVSARTDQGEGIVHFTGHHLVCGGQCATDRNQMRGMDNLIDAWHTEMDTVDVSRCRQVRLVFLDIVEIEKTFFNHLVLCIKKAFFTFWMGRRNRIVICREKNQSCFLFHGRLLSLFRFIFDQTRFDLESDTHVLTGG